MEMPRNRPPSVREVDLVLPRPRPERVSLDGEDVRVEPLDPGRHAADLFRLGHDGTPEAEQSWEYMPYGPFASEPEHRAWLETQAASEDPLFFTVVDRHENRAVGIATLLSIVPAHGSIELGHIWLAPRLQRTRAATEALVLLLRYAMDDLGYRRMEWKCNAANEPSRSAASAAGLPLRRDLLQPPGLQGPQPRHRVVLDPRRGMAAAPRGLRDLARGRQLRSRRRAATAPERAHVTDAPDEFRRLGRSTWTYAVEPPTGDPP